MVQCLMYGVLLLYIDNVYPSESDHQKPLLFFLDFLKRKRAVGETGAEERLINEENENVADTTDALAVFGLYKSFGKYEVLKGINAVFHKGKVHSLLGHNGAGKSTFINMLTGIYKPTKGQILYDNKDFREVRLYGSSELNIGICPSYDIFSESLTVYNHLKIIGLIKNIQNLELRINELIGQLGISQYRNYAVKKLSGGTKRKLTLGIAILSKPNLLFLDEPTSAIDPVSRQEIWKMLVELKRNPDMITLLTTHHLEEAEVLSDSINVLGYGKVLVSGTVENIKRQFGIGYNICIYAETSDNQATFEAVQAQLLQEYGIERQEADSDKLTIKVPMNKVKSIASIMNTIKAAVPSSYKITIDSNTLEQAYFEIDRLYQPEGTVLDSTTVSNILSELYSKRPSLSVYRIWLVTKNRLITIFTNILEVIRIVLTYAYLIITISLLISELMKQKKYIYENIRQIFFIIVLIESSMSSATAYNIVYDKIKDIKTMILINKVSPFEYYFGKYLADMLVQTICYGVLFASIIHDVQAEAGHKSFMRELAFLFISVYLWRAASISMSYLFSRVFTSVSTVSKYYVFVYWLYTFFFMAIKEYFELDWLKYINETLLMFDIINTGNHDLKAMIIPFCCQTVVYFMINLMLEHYSLKSNYVNSENAPVQPEATQNEDAIRLNEEQFDYSGSVAREKQATLNNTNAKLRAVNLRKEYSKNKVALNDVTFNVDKGVHFGLVGQNGAGKSTTFNIILNRILKTSGDVTVDNMRFGGLAPFNPFSPSVFEGNNTAACFQGNALWEDMSVASNLNFYAALNNVQPQALGQLVQYFDFDYYVRKRVSELSTGNQRKLCIIISLLINPTMVFFDEATCGVDLIIRIKLKHLFDELKARNGCIAVFTTHFLKDVELFCDKIGIIKDGNFLCIDSVSTIKRTLGGYLINFAKSTSSDVNDIASGLMKFGQVSKGFKDEMRNTESFIIYELIDLYSLLEYLVQLESSGNIEHFTINQLSIEDIYLKLMNGN